MSVRTYSPKSIQVIVEGNIITGYADGTFISIERTSDAFTKHVGADGETARTKMADKSGTMTLTLMQTSESNTVLGALALRDELSNNGVVPVLVKDSLGVTTIFSGNGWIRKQANVDFANEVGDREWIFDMSRLDYIVGGNEIT